MAYVLLLLAAAVLVGGAYGAGVLRRWHVRRATFAAMAERLRQSYAAAPFDGQPAPLAAPGPPGVAGVSPDGLHLRLGEPSGDLRLVPWAEIQSVTPTAGGRSTVRVSRVGAVVVPAALGRRIWDASGRAGIARAERARPPRV